VSLVSKMVVRGKQHRDLLDPSSESQTMQIGGWMTWIARLVASLRTQRQEVRAVT